MDKTKKIWYLFKNAGYNHNVYRDYEAEISMINYGMILTSSFIGSIMMLLLTAAALFIPSVSKVLPLYLLIAILFISIYIIIRWTKGGNKHVVLTCNYMFLTAAFLFAFGLDIIQKNPTATTICVLLSVLPLLIVDKPLREIGYFAVMAVIFILESKYIKHSPKASVDALNSVSFYIIGIFLGYKHNQMMLRNIKGQDMLQRQRDTDSLTGLYNKGAIERKAVDFMGRENVTASMIIIDMDNFKHVNDTYGHHAGDEILIKISEVLRSKFRSSDYISRFGGDEFTIFLPMTDDKEILKAKAEQILGDVANIRIEADPDYRAQICMGIATFPEGGREYEELFRNADSAMYRVKKHGKNGYRFYDANEKKKILLVDDIEVNRAVLFSVLQDEFNILEAEDGKSALTTLNENDDIAMVITDIQMPNMDGIELIKHIRSNPIYDDVAIIANTQYGDLKQEQETFSLGIDDFVYKPSSPKAIQIRVKNVLKLKQESN